VRYCDRTARRLARTLAYAMARFGPGLEKRQSTLFRLVDIGAELFAMAAASTYAVQQQKQSGERSPLVLADTFCRGARRRIRQHFAVVFANDDRYNYRIAQQILAGDHQWLENGIILPPTPEAPA
jgi:ACAD9/ACADV, C-terminal domain